MKSVFAPLVEDGLLIIQNYPDSTVQALHLCSFCVVAQLQSELSVFHTAEYIARFCPSDDNGDSESVECVQHRMRILQEDRVVATLPCGGFGVDSDTVWNAAYTSKSARLAVGQVMCLADRCSHLHIPLK